MPIGATEFGIKCLPTLVFLRDGLEVERIVGAVTERAIENTLKDALMEVKPIYEDIQKTLGISFVPNLFQAMGNHPEYLEVTWNQFKVAMGPGGLTPREKELVALGVSTTNHCKYSIGAHTAALRRLGLTEKGLIELMGVVGLEWQSHRNKSNEAGAARKERSQQKFLREIMFYSSTG